MPIFTKDGKSILFIHIPKCGGSSITDAFRQMGYTVLLEISGLPPQKSLIASPQHLTSSELKSTVQFNEIDDVFTVVRNPYDRLFSEYKWATRKISDPSHLPTFESWANEQISLAKIDPNHADNHIRPMLDFISQDIPCKVFRYEAGINIISEYYSPGELIDAPPMGERNRSTPPPSHGNSSWHLPANAEHLSRESLSLINDFYKHDFAAFCYQPYRINTEAALHPPNASTQEHTNQDAISKTAFMQAVCSQDCISLLSQKLQTLRRSCKSMRQHDLQDFSQEMSALTKNLHDLSSERDQLAAEATNLQSERDQLAAEATNLQSERDRLAAEATKLGSVLDQLRAELHISQQDLKAVRKENETVSAQLQQALEGLEKYYLLYKNRQHDLDKALSKLNWNREQLQNLLAFAKASTRSRQLALNLVSQVALALTSKNAAKDNF